MNWNEIQEKWKEFENDVKVRWSKLTSDDINSISGKRETLSERIQNAYGYNKDKAEKEIEDFSQSLSSKPRNTTPEKTGSDKRAV